MKRRDYLKKTAVSATGMIMVPTIIPSSVLGKNAPSNKINIGQIGCGRIARDHDLPGTMQYEIARIVAIADVDMKRAKEGKEHVEQYYNEKKQSDRFVDLKLYQDYREMLLDSDIDAVMISTPDHWHAQPAIEAALAGKDIYLQKPTSLTIAEGRALADVIRLKGTILQVGTQQRSSPQFRIAAELVRNGRIGKLHTVRIGLPGDPAGEAEPEMATPENLDYDMWLGSTPEAYYTEKRVHPHSGYSRPGWLRCEQFGAGMITGWGQHHIDSAHWGMNTELTGPEEVEAIAEFPRSGLWDVHGDFMVKAKYDDDVMMFISGGYTNGIRYEGSEGWIFVSRGNYSATASDPVSQAASAKALDASDPKILTSKIGENETHLYVSEEHHGNWLDCIQSRKQPICTAEVGHRTCSTCLISHIAMKLDRKLYWDAANERFKGDDEANAMLSRSQRAPWGYTHIKELSGMMSKT
ncbi:MAG: Gfo/Idh/MocA family oxidoreductase [Saprospiraceae bacterium]|nr:Gfo/Idh/MocA family oxidoreductase [Saprospiraceae bacterium]